MSKVALNLCITIFRFDASLHVFDEVCVPCGPQCNLLDMHCSYARLILNSLLECFSLSLTFNIVVHVVTLLWMIPAMIFL